MKKPTPNSLITDICKKLQHDFDSWESIPNKKPHDEQKKERVKLYSEIKKKMEDLK